MTFTAQRPFRLAILECDTPMDRVLATRGTLGDIFTRYFQAAASTMDPAVLPPGALVIRAFDVVTAQAYPALDDMDACLVTGSQHMPYADDAWIVKLDGFLRRVLATPRLRIVGVCFGHQMLGRALGAVVEKHTDWEISVADVQLTEKGRVIFGRESLAIQQMRRARIRECPAGVDEIAYTGHCTHGLYKKGRFISIQGHPEYDGEMMRWVIEDRQRRGILPDDLSKDGLARVDNHSDGPLVIKRFLEFLLED